MKRLYLAISILLSLVIISAMGLFITHQTHENLTVILDEAISAATQKDYETAEKMAVSFAQSWSQCEDLLVPFVRHGDIDIISSGSARIVPLIQYRDLPEFIAECNRLKQIVNHLWDAEKPHPKNMI